ncbi:MAG: hypothetical protein ACE5FF_11420 [Saprospiraceae bacterium]
MGSYILFHLRLPLPVQPAVDENCNLVCAPDGGFTAGRDGNCPNFRRMRLPFRSERNNSNRKKPATPKA